MVYFLIFVTSLFAQSAAEKRVNEHLIKTQKKMEIESQKKEVELKKNHEPISGERAPKKKEQPFVTEPERPYAPDPEIYEDQYDRSMGADPSAQIEHDVKLQKEDPSEAEKAEFIKQFKKNAERSGVKVEIDPKTFKAKPIK